MSIRAVVNAKYLQVKNKDKNIRAPNDYVNIVGDGI